MMYKPYSTLFCQHSGRRYLADRKYQQELTSACAHSKLAAYRQSSLKISNHNNQSSPTVTVALTLVAHGI